MKQLTILMKKLMKNKMKMAAAVGAVVLGVGASVQAIPITGNINFSGTSATLNGTSLNASETKFTAINSVTVQAGDENASYLALNAGGTSASFGTFLNVDFNPVSAPVKLWSVTSGLLTYSFYATSGTSDYFSLGSEKFLNIGGKGYAVITGGATPYTDEYGTWSITDTQTGTGKITFSATTSIPAVPDGGLTVSLLGMALGGCAIIGRKMKSLA